MAAPPRRLKYVQAAHVFPATASRARNCFGARTSAALARGENHIPFGNWTLVLRRTQQPTHSGRSRCLHTRLPSCQRRVSSAVCRPTSSIPEMRADPPDIASGSSCRVIGPRPKAVCTCRRVQFASARPVSRRPPEEPSRPASRLLKTAYQALWRSRRGRQPGHGTADGIGPG